MRAAVREQNFHSELKRIVLSINYLDLSYAMIHIPFSAIWITAFVWVHNVKAAPSLSISISLVVAMVRQTLAGSLVPIHLRS